MSTLQGALLYDKTSGENVELYYVTMSASLFSTDILDLVEMCLGSPLPSVFSFLSGLLQDALVGIAEGVYDAPRASDVLDLIPEFLPETLPIPTIAYLQGGTPQTYIAPYDLYLKDIEIKPVTLGLLTTDISSLEFFGVRACKCLYSKELKPSDSALPENILVQESQSGHYVVYRPPYGAYNDNSLQETANMDIAKYDFNQNSSSCVCHAVGGLWGEEPLPANPGHYLNPYAPIAISSPTFYNGALLPLMLSSWGTNFSMPFSVTSPSAATRTALKWNKYSVYGGENITRNYRSQPYRIGGAIGGRVGKKPKKDFIVKEFVTKKGGGLTVVMAAVMGLLWLKGRER